MKPFAYWVTLIRPVLVVCFLIRMMVGASENVIHVDIACPGYINISIAQSALGYNGPAFEAAVAESNKRYAGVFNFTLSFLTDDRKVRDGFDFTAESLELITSWYYKRYEGSTDKVLRVIISPGSIDGTNVQQLMANWGIMSILTSGSTISDYKLPAPLILRFSYTSLAPIAVNFIDILRMFNWTTVFLVTDYGASEGMFAYLAAEFIQIVASINAATERKLLTLHQRRVTSGRPIPFQTQLVTVLTEFQSTSRVMIFLGRGEFLRQLLLTAHRLSMTTGEFAYLAYESTPILRAEANVTWQKGDGDDLAARDAFESLLLVHLNEEERQRLESPKVVALTEWTRQRSREEFNITLSYNQMPVPGVISAYRGVEIFAQVLNESRHQHGIASLYDGFTLSRAFLNRSFPGDLSEVFLDQSGTRRVEYVLSYFAAGRGHRRQVFLRQRKEDNFAMQIVGKIADFWPGSEWPPRNEPLCGYRNEKPICFKGNSFLQTAVAATSGAGAVLSVVCFIVRRWITSFRLLHLLWWNLDSNQLVMKQQRLLRRAQSIFQRVGAFAMCVGSRVELDHSATQFASMVQKWDSRY
ncbi:hypothetical protein BV898_13194 [Hypsibius exemplaris]|uniref:Receptor ligand binding region domain-containing protein n=1 Tax=Hypsibius exemplaris TaxID=2072580 RepID=A0A1W0WBG6_HYPEX|nr:hypothetical protein BV898_13194 [Hypsibius exemplaris]